MFETCFLLAAVFLLACYWTKLAKTSKSPPGPFGIPFIGNVHQVSRKCSWKQFKQWHEVYGPIISLRLGQVTVILLGNHKIARELFYRRGAIYSSRPRMVLASECFGKGFGAALLPYGPAWRQAHKIQMSFMTARRCQLYQPLQELESCHLLFNLLSTDNFEPELYRFSSSLLFALLNGKRFLTGEEPDLRETEELATSVLQAISFGNWIVDLFPFLNKLPRSIAKWKQVGDEFHDRRAQLYEKNAVKAAQRKPWSWTKQSLLHDKPSVSRKELTYILGELYETGSHTTAGALLVSILACVSSPKAMQCAQHELDRQIGSHRLPGLDDVPNLPYLQAFVHEVLRWRPLAPGGVPHCPVHDDYQGLLIPQGATVMATHWCLEMDETIFERAEEFLPERWIKDAHLPSAAFGFGRRSCPGQVLARNSLILVVSRLLWAFDIRWKEGQKVKPESVGLTHEGIFSKPCSFEATFMTRSQAHEEVIRKQWEGYTDGYDDILNRIGARFSGA